MNEGDAGCVGLLGGAMVGLLSASLSAWLIDPLLTLGVSAGVVILILLIMATAWMKELDK